MVPLLVHPWRNQTKSLPETSFQFENNVRICEMATRFHVVVKMLTVLEV